MSRAVIRPATPADCSAVAAMVLELAAQHGVASGTTGEGLRNEAFGPRPTIEIIVADIDAALVGYLVHQDTYSTWRGANGVFVVDLFVRPDRRGLGIGEALMAEAARRGLEKGARFMRLDIDIENEAGARFYGRLGFDEKPHDRFMAIEAEPMRRLAGG